jgi:hypothetical protein
MWKLRTDPEIRYFLQFCVTYNVTILCRVMLARSKDHCALTLSATFIVWKQGTILQKKENTDGILRFEKQQKEIEAVMQQSQKYRESLEAEKAALVRKYERLAAESKSSEVQMQKDVKDMKQKLEESLRVAEQFHQQLMDQKTTSEDMQRGLEHQLDDIRIKLSTAEGKKNACQTKLLQIEKDVRAGTVFAHAWHGIFLFNTFCSSQTQRLSWMLKMSKLRCSALKMRTFLLKNTFLSKNYQAKPKLSFRKIEMPKSLQIKRSSSKFCLMMCNCSSLNVSLQKRTLEG